MGIVLIAVYGNEDEDVAQDAQDKQPQVGGRHLALHQTGGNCLDAGLAGHAGQAFQPGQEHYAQEVSHPDEHQVPQVGGQAVVKEVTGLAGKQGVPSGADGEQANGKQQGPHHIAPWKGVLEFEKYRAAQADAKAG